MTSGTTRFPQGPITDSTGYVTLEWAQWFQNPSVVTIVVSGTVDVDSGGTGLSSGVSGGILAFNSSTTIISSATLANHRIVLGGGAGAAPSTPVGLGTSTTILHGNATGAPSFAAVSLSADVSGTLPVANGGTGITSGTSGGIPAFTATGTIASSGALLANGIVLGGGAGAAPSTPAPATLTSALNNALVPKELMQVRGTGGATRYVVLYG